MRSRHLGRSWTRDVSRWYAYFLMSAQVTRLSSSIQTEALDNNFALSTRLRQLTKDKVASRDELLSVRAERQAVAYKIDAARRKHEYNALAAKVRTCLLA